MGRGCRALWLGGEEEERGLKMVENKGGAAKGKIPLLSVLDHFRCREGECDKVKAPSLREGPYHVFVSQTGGVTLLQ